MLKMLVVYAQQRDCASLRVHVGVSRRHGFKWGL